MPIGPSERIAAVIREDIDSGAISSGAKLPGERELARIHEVSISTISRAIAQLRGEKYIESRRGLGNFAADRPGRLTIDPETALRLSHRKSRSDPASARIATDLDVDPDSLVHVVTWLARVEDRVVARIAAVSTCVPTEDDLYGGDRDTIVSARLPDESEVEQLRISALTPVLVVTQRRRRTRNTPGVTVDFVYPSATVHLAWPPRLDKH